MALIPAAAGKLQCFCTLAALLLVVGIAQAQAPPFKVLAIVPSVQDEANDQPYGLDGQQDLTVLFSRSVIALGSDFDNTTFTTGNGHPAFRTS